MRTVRLRCFSFPVAIESICAVRLSCDVVALPLLLRLRNTGAILDLLSNFSPINFEASYSLTSLTFDGVFQQSQYGKVVGLHGQFDWRAATVIGLVRIGAVLQKGRNALLVAFLRRNAQRRCALLARMITRGPVVEKHFHDPIVALPGARVERRTEVEVHCVHISAPCHKRISQNLKMIQLECSLSL